MPYYSVHRGRNPGIYNTWAEASKMLTILMELSTKNLLI